MEAYELIERTLSKNDFILEGNDRRAKVVCALGWWVVNLCDGTVLERTQYGAAKRVAEKYIETGATPRYGRVM